MVGVLSGFTRWYHRSEEVCEHQPCQRNMSMQPYVALVNVVAVIGGGGAVDLCALLWLLSCHGLNFGRKFFSDPFALVGLQ